MAKKKMQAVVEIAGNIDPSLGKAIDGATKQLGGINWKAVAVGAAVGGIAIATGKAVVEAGKYLKDLGGQFEQAENAIRIGTGATGEALDGLLDDFDEIYKSVPASMDEVGTAVADFNTRLGLSGPALQGLSKQAIQVSDMLGDDLSGVIKGSSEAFQIWNVDAENMAGAMDYVFKASQSTGVGFTDLMTKTQQFAPQLQELGYGFEESIALIGQMEKAGVNTDEALAAMKKSVGTLAKEGMSASEGMQHYYEQIEKAGTAAEATAIANEVFGTRAGSTMAAAIRDGTLSVADLTAELQANSETISGAAEDTYTLEERMQMFRQQAEVALKPLANTLLDSLGKLMPAVSKAMEALTPVIEDLVETIAPLIEQLFDSLVPVLESLLPIVVEVGGKLLQKLIPPIMQIIDAILPVLLQLLDALMPILDIIIELLGPILDLVMQLLGPILNLISEAIAPLIQVLGMLISTALQPLGPLIEWVSGILTGVLGSAIEAVKPIIDSMIAVFGGFIDFIQNVFAGNWGAAWENIIGIFGNIFNGIKALFKAPINFIIGGINSFLGGINKIKIPKWVPGVGGKGINIPMIPKLATGGFTEGLSIAGEAGVEAVISFDPKYRKNNIEYWQQAGAMLGVYDEANGTQGVTSIINNTKNYTRGTIMPETEPLIVAIDGIPKLATRGSSNDGSYDQTLSNAGRLLNTEGFSLSEMTENYTIVYDFGGVEFAPQIEVYGDADKNELIKKLKEYEADFFDYLEEWLRQREVGRYAPANNPVY